MVYIRITRAHHCPYLNMNEKVQILNFLIATHTLYFLILGMGVCGYVFS